MKKLLTILFISSIFFACKDEDDKRYTRNELTYQLFQSSDFAYTGVATLRELNSGELEMEITLDGPKDATPYFFPAHLHFGGYDQADSPIAFLLNPIDIRTLKSTTRLSTLSDGSLLSFEDFKNFDGHIKIHLADSGPEYTIYLTVGNVGRNDNSRAAFDRNAISLCAPELKGVE
jgi:hypothetical protein